MQTPQPYANPRGAAQLSTGRIDNKKIGEFFERPAPVNARPESIGTRVGVASAAKTSADMMQAVGYQWAHTPKSLERYGSTATFSNSPINRRQAAVMARTRGEAIRACLQLRPAQGPATTAARGT